MSLKFFIVLYHRSFFLNRSQENTPENSSFLIDSQNQKLNSRKRPQRRDIITQENYKRLIADDDQDEEFQENVVPSNTASSHVIQKQNKRKRRH